MRHSLLVGHLDEKRLSVRGPHRPHAKADILVRWRRNDAFIRPEGNRIDRHWRNAGANIAKWHTRFIKIVLSIVRKRHPRTRIDETVDNLSGTNIQNQKRPRRINVQAALNRDTVITRPLKPRHGLPRDRAARLAKLHRRLRE